MTSFLNESGKQADLDHPMLSHLQLRNFRIYERLDLGLESGLTLITGANAQGKTTILEAAAYLSTGRLLRTKRDQEAIRVGSEEAVVKGQVSPTDSQLCIRIPAGGRKKASVNGMDIPRVSDLIGRLPSTSVSSADLALTQGEPSDRRLFLDLELSMIYGGYLKALAGYKRATEQRNSLLKLAFEQRVEAEQFETWEAAMAQFGSTVRGHRMEYCQTLALASRAAHAKLGGGEKLQLQYRAADEARTESELRAKLEESRDRDKARGSSTVGPHRDDFDLQAGGMDLRAFGSQGQRRTAAIALKIAAFHVSRETTGIPPLLLLDDMLSDLDQNRRSALAELVTEEAGQAILTCTEAEAVGSDIVSRATVLTVKGGKVTSA